VRGLVVRRYSQRVLLERRDFFEIEIAAVQFLPVVAADRKLKWDRLLIAGRVHSDQGCIARHRIRQTGVARGSGIGPNC
jgi:hypothetical protein